MNTDLYKYILPKELIAQEPKEPRDSSKLFIFDTKNNEITHDYFFNLHKYIPKESLFILNKTKVLKSRTHLYKETGGKFECFFLVNEIKDWNHIPALVNRKLKVGDVVFSFDKKFSFTISFQQENIFFLKPNFEKYLFFQFLEGVGETPLPPYIKTDTNLYERYNTVFAEKGRSVAAPTASLHFTEKVFKNLSENGCDFADVFLEIGLGTFKNPTEENFKNSTLHKEPCLIKKEAFFKILEAKKNHKKIVTVGTTATRSLETVNIKNIKFKNEDMSFDTDIFIKPPYKFMYTDILITNFHLPETSLMMLVQAFLENKKSQKNIRELYEEAIKNSYRFFSFGDCMLIL